MAKYVIEWSERKTTKTGKPVLSTSLKGEDGAVIENVSIWGDFQDFANLMTGQTVMGDIVRNDKGYESLYPPKNAATGNSGGFKKNIEKVMEAKQEGIKLSQENKEHGIKVASTIAMATNIVLALMKDDKTVIWTDQLVKDEIKKWRAFLWNEWEKENKDFPPFNS